MHLGAINANIIAKHVYHLMIIVYHAKDKIEFLIHLYVVVKMDFLMMVKIKIVNNVIMFAKRVVLKRITVKFVKKIQPQDKVRQVVRF